MYRIKTWGGYAYRCTGAGPQRKGCGNMIPVDDLDQRVTAAMLSLSGVDHMEQVFIPGDNRSDAILRLRLSGSEAFLKGDYAAANEAGRQAAEMESQPRVAPHWESRETGATVAERFTSLSGAERREDLLSYEIEAGRDRLGIYLQDGDYPDDREARFAIWECPASAVDEAEIKRIAQAAKARMA
jgi:hypothetical protein